MKKPDKRSVKMNYTRNINCMVNLKLKLFSWLLLRLLKKKAPDRISRSGKAGATADYYSVHYVENGQPVYLIEGYNREADILFVRRWNTENSMFQDEENINLSSLNLNNFRVDHFYGLYDIYFTGIYDLYFQYVTKFVYVKIFFQSLWDFLSQKTYNKRSFKTKTRIDLLKFIVDKQFLQDVERRQRWMSLENREFNRISLMTELYSMKWVRHPFGDQESSKLGMYLESLALSGELERVRENNYRITGKALETIEIFNENELRHKDSLKIQNRVLWLTVFMALVGVLGIAAQLIGPSDYFKAYPWWEPCRHSTNCKY